MDLKTMNSVEACFTGNQRTYTYAVKPELDVKEGDKFLTKTPSKGWTYVSIHKVHKVSQLDPNAKFEYKELKCVITTRETNGVFYVCAPKHCDMVGKGVNEEEALGELFTKLNA